MRLSPAAVKASLVLAPVALLFTAAAAYELGAAAPLPPPVVQEVEVKVPGPKVTVTKAVVPRACRELVTTMENLANVRVELKGTTIRTSRDYFMVNEMAAKLVYLEQDVEDLKEKCFDA